MTLNFSNTFHTHWTRVQYFITFIRCFAVKYSFLINRTVFETSVIMYLIICNQPTPSLGGYPFKFVSMTGVVAGYKKIPTKWRRIGEKFPKIFRSFLLSNEIEIVIPYFTPLRPSSDLFELSGPKKLLERQCFSVLRNWGSKTFTNRCNR